MPDESSGVSVSPAMEFAVSSGKGKTVSPIEANDSYLTLKLVEVGRDQSTRFLPEIRGSLDLCSGGALALPTNFGHIPNALIRVPFTA